MASVTKKIMHSLLKLFVLTLAYSSARVSAQTYHTLVTSITRHENSAIPICSIKLSDHSNYIIDLDAPFTWFGCPLQPESYRPVPCSVLQCNDFQLYSSVKCPYYDLRESVDYPCYCLDTPVNPVTQQCAVANTTYTDLALYWTDGRLPTRGVGLGSVYASWAPMSLLQSLPEEVVGVASMSWASLSVVNTFTFYYQASQKFALCLPSSGTSSGTMFTGDGPYFINSSSSFDAATVLSYTPLIRHPLKLGYYINVTSMSINGRISRIATKYFQIQRLGHGGVKLSTTVPYTTLRSDIYDTVLGDFRNAARRVPKAKPVNPFGLCFMTNTNEWRKWQVPKIELHLVNGVNWTIDAANSMKQVNETVACLAFIDGGFAAGQAIVIGSYQMENNFVVFDLAQSKLGYGSLLSYVESRPVRFGP